MNTIFWTLVMGLVFGELWSFMVKYPTTSNEWMGVIFMYLLTNTIHGIIMQYIESDDPGAPDGFI